MPLVKIPPVLRSRTGGEVEVDADGSTVGEVLDALAQAHPDTRDQLFSEDGALNRYVNVYLNDEDVRVLDGVDTPVGESDTVVILPAMAGGALKQSLVARLRSSRAAWTAYNLLHYRELRKNSEHYRRLGIRRPVVAPIAHRDIAQAEGLPAWLDRPDAKQALRAHPEFANFDERLQGKLEGWVDDGFLILEGHLSEAEVDQINADVQRLFDEGAVRYHALSPRIMNAFEHSEPIARLVSDPELLSLLGFILGRDVSLFQTINFFTGSQQAAHSDSFHMTTEPEGYLTAIWVALEDVEPGAGPLFYHPGSHRLAYVMTEHLGEGADGESKEDRYSRRIVELIAERGLEPVEFAARKGDLLVWHANLLHGGRAIEREGATRKSLVAHYFADGVLCYHESTERPALVRSR